MRAVHIYVKGGVAWVLGGSKGITIKLEDADNGETVYYGVEGAEVYELMNPMLIELAENELKCLEED